MDRLLSCECGREHIVSQSQAGQELKCDCGKIVAVPTLRGLASLPLAPATAQAADPTATSGDRTRTGVGASRRWQGWRGPAMALASAGFIIAFAACGWFSFQRFSINTSYTVDNEIKAGSEMFDSYDVATLSTVWHGFGKMGLRTKQPPTFYLWNLYAKDRARRAIISGSIAAAFAAIALAIGFSARQSRE